MFRHADAVAKVLRKPSSTLRIFTLQNFTAMGLPAPIEHDPADPDDVPFAEWSEQTRRGTWRDVAAELQGRGFIAFGFADGLAVYPGQWKGAARADATWAEHGADQAEERVYKWLDMLVVYEPDTLQAAAALVLQNTTREQALAALATELAYFKMGVDSTCGGDGEAARTAAEHAIWRAFRRRLRELSRAAGMTSARPNMLSAEVRQ